MGHIAENWKAVIDKETPLDESPLIATLTTGTPQQKYGAMLEIRERGRSTTSVADALLELLSNEAQFWGYAAGPKPVKSGEFVLVPAGSTWEIIDISSEAARTLVVIEKADILIPQFIQKLQGKNVQAQESAAVGLEEMGEKASSAVPYLIDLLETDRGFVSSLAHKALKKITSKDIPADAQAWEKYWKERKE